MNQSERFTVSLLEYDEPLLNALRDELGVMGWYDEIDQSYAFRFDWRCEEKRVCLLKQLCETAFILSLDVTIY